jgi:hypothetical protein
MTATDDKFLINKSIQEKMEKICILKEISFLQMFLQTVMIIITTETP